jgi:hypothetical protein
MPTISTKKRDAVVRAFGDIEHLDQPHYLDWLYARRHLAKVRTGKRLELRYAIEEDELVQTVRKALDRIRKRDGAKIANEVAAALVDRIVD